MVWPLRAQPRRSPAIRPAQPTPRHCAPDALWKAAVLALLQSFRLIALLEGASYVLLLGVAMPLKYWADMPIAVRIVGSLHGALFVAYAVCVALLFFRGHWSFNRSALAMLVSIIPFATFVWDRSIREELATAGTRRLEPEA